MSRKHQRGDEEGVRAVAGINDARATAMLCSHVTDEDWLLRYSAVGALARRGVAEGRSCLERALTDAHLVVWSRAIEGDQPLRACDRTTLYEEQLRQKDLTPLLRTEVESALKDLRRRNR